MGHHLEVNEVGIVIGLTSIGQDYIDLCQLNRATLVNFRLRVLRILNLLDEGIDPELMEVALEFFQLPKQLPDLSKLHPKENKRPEGIAQSYFAKAQRGDS